MLKNLLKITLRNLLKFKGYSTINIVGLALGMSCGLVIFLLALMTVAYQSIKTVLSNPVESLRYE